MRSLLCLLTAWLLTACTGLADGIRPVTGFQLDRYLGTWYEIDRLPMRHEPEDATDVSAFYSLNDDGSVRVQNRCLHKGELEEAIGQATPIDASNSRLQVSSQESDPSQPGSAIQLKASPPSTGATFGRRLLNMVTFGAYTKYSLISAGYGDRLYQGDGISIDAEIGPGYYTGKTSGDITEKGALVRTAGSLDWVISDSATFRQLLSLEAGSDNKRTQSETSVSARINGSMQMKAAFTVMHDSEVPVGKKNTDTQTSLTLVYSF